MTRAAGADLSLAASIGAAIRDASAAQPVTFHPLPDGSGDVRAVRHPVPAAALRRLPVAFTGAITTTTPATPAEALGAEIARRSILAQLGLRLIQVRGDAEPATSIVGSDGQAVPVSRTVRAEFSLPHPAPFAQIDEDDEAVEVATLADRTELGASGLRVHGFRHMVSRATMKARDPATIAAELAESVMAGAARLIDRLALESLATDGGLPVGDIRAAGAAGVQFDRLRAVIGTGALAVAPVADRGALFHAGVPAVLTDQANGGFLGSWETHAVAHSPEIAVLVTKTNARGDLILSAWMGAIGLSPINGATKIWRLA